MDSGASRCRFTNTLAFARCQALHPALPEASAPVALGAPGQAEQGQRRRKRQPMSPSPLHPLQKPEAPSGFGRTLRVSLGDADQRIFTPTPQGSPSWRRGYARLTDQDRFHIKTRLDAGDSMRSIAGGPVQSPSTNTSAAARALLDMLRPHRADVRTLTFDNGREFSRHGRIARALDCGCYFAKPHYSWEKGAVENANGLLRQYFPKRLRLDAQALRDAVADLNNRPRKRLGWDSPMLAYQRETRKGIQMGLWYAGETKKGRVLRWRLLKFSTSWHQQSIFEIGSCTTTGCCPG